MLGARCDSRSGRPPSPAGGWVLRALQGAPAALGARPARSARSPGARRTIATASSSTSSRRRRSASTARSSACSSGELIGVASAQHRPRKPIPLVDCRRRWTPHRRPRRHLVRPLLGAGRGRRLPRAHRPGVERPLLAVADGRPASGCTRCRCRSRRCRARRRDHQPRPLRPPRHRHHRQRWPARQRAPFVVPLGVGAHLRTWGHPRRTASSNSTGTRAHRIGDLTLVCTPARHFSGRFLTRNITLWASWVIIGPRHRAFFGGDTGYTKSFAEIGADHGPFDLTLMPIGAYHPAWPDIHMNPEEAVRAHLDVAEPTRAAAADPLGDVPARPASVGRARRAAARRRRPGRRRSGGAAPGSARRSTARSSRARGVRPVVAAITG